MSTKRRRFDKANEGRCPNEKNPLDLAPRKANTICSNSLIRNWCTGFARGLGKYMGEYLADWLATLPRS